ETLSGELSFYLTPEGNFRTRPKFISHRKMNFKRLNLLSSGKRQVSIASETYLFRKDNFRPGSLFVRRRTTNFPAGPKFIFFRETIFGRPGTLFFRRRQISAA